MAGSAWLCFVQRIVGEREPERGATSQCGFNPDFPAQFLDDALVDGQTQACTFRKGI